MSVFVSGLTRRLSVWSGFSVIAGAFLAFSRPAFWRGVGGQFLAWGAIDGLIAWLGGRLMRPRSGQTGRLQRILLLNAGLDVGYVLGGLVLALSRGKRDPYWRGAGWGIVLQGLFLFGFDLFHVCRVPVED